MAPIAQPVLLTVAEAGVRLRLSKSSVAREIHAGELRAERLGPKGGAIRIPEDAIAEYRAARATGTTAIPTPTPPHRESRTSHPDNDTEEAP